MLVRGFSILALWCSPAAGISAVCVNGHPTPLLEFDQSAGVFVGTVTAERHVPALNPYFDLDGTMYTVRGVLDGRENEEGRPVETEAAWNS